MWVYSSGTGRMYKDDNYVWTGYSGHGSGLNNPVYENTPFVGPIPRGSFTFGMPENHPKLGDWAIPIIPDPGTNTFGRGGFYLHGDNSEHDETASEGCIVRSPKSDRMLFAEGDKLTVV
jgi:hypothetical protein